MNIIVVVYTFLINRVAVFVRKNPTIIVLYSVIIVFLRNVYTMQAVDKEVVRISYK